MNTVEIGMRIKKQRQLLHYSREQMAEMLNITPRFCYDLELGNKKMSIDTLCRMSNVLNISTDYLLYGKSEVSGYDTIISLLKVCPEDKLEQLELIISAYVDAVS